MIVATHVEIICGTEVEFFTFDEGDTPHPEGKDVQGLYDPVACRIYVLGNRSDAAMRETRNHERIHAVIDLSGAAFWFQQVANGSRRSEDPETLEEELVRILTPHIKELQNT